MIPFGHVPLTDSEQARLIELRRKHRGCNTCPTCHRGIADVSLTDDEFAEYVRLAERLLGEAKYEESRRKGGIEARRRQGQ